MLGLEPRSTFQALVAMLCLVANGWMPTACAAPAMSPATPRGGLSVNVTAFADADSYATAVASQPDGRIVVAGHCLRGSIRLCMARFLPDGELDSSFGIGGQVHTSVPGIASSITVDSEGYIVIVGACYRAVSTYSCVSRFNRRGFLDRQFARAQRRNRFAGFYAYGVLPQPSGGYAVAGYCHADGGTPRMCVVRYSASGDADLSFGVRGTAYANYSTGASYGFVLVALSDGAIAVAGSCASGEALRFCVGVFSTTGEPDRRFGSDGIAVDSQRTWNSVATALATQSDGGLLIAGYCDQRTGKTVCLSRWDSGGRLDQTFGDGGHMVIAQGPGNSYGLALVVRPSDQVVVAGKRTAPGRRMHGFVMRLPARAQSAISTTSERFETIHAGWGESAIAALVVTPIGEVIGAGQCEMNGTTHLCTFRLREGEIDSYAHQTTDHSH